LLLGGDACVLFAVVVLIATQPTQWSWPLLVWGVLVGVLGAAIIEFVAAYSFRREPPTSIQRTRWNRRRLIYDGCWMFFGTMIGLVAAAFDLAWIDIVLTVWALASLGAGAVVYVVAVRRRGHR
jgi:hypothetical protein